MPDIRYPPEPEGGQTRIEWERRALNPWRQEEKRRLLAERGPMCSRPGCLNRAQDLDEAILTRQDMRGLPLWKRRLAFCNINLELTCPTCNRERAQDREGAWYRAVDRYGANAVFGWYLSLNLKAPRAEFLADDQEPA